jgi:enoyl-CoA hydratase/carnithine racemase
MESANSVDVSRLGRVLVISMNRESKRNAIDRVLADALEDALNELDDDSSIWVGVLTGTLKIFSAGSDFKSKGDYFTARGGEYGMIRRSRRKPLIAAVEGAALGGGFEILLACDMVVASKSARFGLPEVAKGVVPTCGAIFRGPRSLPLNLVREMILTGASIDVERAYEAGFVNLVTETGEALAGAIQMADRVCENAPLSVQACLAAINNYTGENDAVGWEATAHAVQAVAKTDDFQEGPKAFLENRSPIWKGR